MESVPQDAVSSRKRGSKPDKWLDRPPDLIASQLRAARMERGWSLEKAAAETGIPVPVLGSWERGDRQPPIGKLRGWAAAFGCELQVAVIRPEATHDPGATWVEYTVRFPLASGGYDAVTGLNYFAAEDLTAAIPGAMLLRREVYAAPWAEVTDGGEVR